MTKNEFLKCISSSFYISMSLSNILVKHCLAANAVIKMNKSFITNNLQHDRM